MKIRCLCLLVAGMLSTTSTVAQSKQVTYQQLAWFSYANTIRFHPKWSLTSEIHERRFINPNRHHQFVLRSQTRYALGENWEAVAGFTYFLQSPNDPRATQRLVVPELRPHIQFNYNQPLGRLTITHRYRAEKRFFRNTNNGELAPGYTTNYRFRYRLGIEYRLTDINDQPLKLKVNDELHVNAGKQILYNRFDQNRIYAGLSYALLGNLEVEAGYLNWYQQRSAGDQFYNRHILNVAITHRMDLTNRRKHAAE
jgi:long-subunit fatty acid transport protein